MNDVDWCSVPRPPRVLPQEMQPFCCADDIAAVAVASPSLTGNMASGNCWRAQDGDRMSESPVSYDKKPMEMENGVYRARPA